MICNIIDQRNRPYRWRLVNAIVEPAWHDNSLEDSDSAARTQAESDYEERKRVSVADAIRWAEALPFPATLFLYDVDDLPDTAFLRPS
jgi:hypothetical protein